MVPKKGDSYLKVKTLYVGWALHMAGHPYGEWSLLKILWQPVTPDGPEIKVGALLFMRSLTPAELWRVTRRKNIWGMKMPGEQWALVMGSPSDQASHTTFSSPNVDPARAVGV